MTDSISVSSDQCSVICSIVSRHQADFFVIVSEVMIAGMALGNEVLRRTRRMKICAIPALSKVEGRMKKKAGMSRVMRIEVRGVEWKP